MPPADKQKEELQLNQKIINEGMCFITEKVVLIRGFCELTLYRIQNMEEELAVLVRLYNHVGLGMA